jgi:uncharacterized RDD family membrane protein YckC
MYVRKLQPKSSLVIAGRGRRLGALLIDGLILGLVQQVLSALYAPPQITGPHLLAASLELSLPLSQWKLDITLAVITFCYFWLQHARSGQTLGKRVLGIRVVDAETLDPVGSGRAGIRALYYLWALIPVLGALFQTLDMLWIFWDQRKQTLHDKIAETIVVSNRPSPPPESVNPYGAEL